MRTMGRAARAAAEVLAFVPTAQKNRALLAAAAALRASLRKLLEANEGDMREAAARGLPAALLDRLRLDETRVETMARGLEDIARLDDPIGTHLAEWSRPNGMRIQRVCVPLGVIGIIYESRPNVTADAGGLCLKSSNAVILRGGSESTRSNAAIHACLVQGLHAAELPADAVQWVPTSDRAAVGHMLADMADSIDVIVPRGGKKLIARVQKEARVPVIGHLEGVCHVYVDRRANLAMANRITVNAKMRRTGVCGVGGNAAGRSRVRADASCATGQISARCGLRGARRCSDAAASMRRVKPATEQDWYTEYLDAIIAVRVVDDVDSAIAHIAQYGSQHTDCIVTDDAAAAERFLTRVDSAIVLHNASTQFADGGEFGMGAEIGISTDKFHARGPVGVAQLTSYKYVVRGAGQIRD